MSNDSGQQAHEGGRQSARRPIDWRTFGIIVVGAALLALYIQRPLDEIGASVPRMAVVDMDRILRAKALSVGAADAATVGAAAEDFVRRVKAEVDGLKADGLMVINSSHLVAWPDAMDLTEEIAARIGVDLKLAASDEDLRASRAKALFDQASTAKK